MEEEKDVVAAGQEEEVTRATRIFVGGLGDKVTEEDLHKTFSSLGAVNGVEFVRSGGRSFAYIDFQPASLKSLAKLFSSYNGCVWKGGRLKLEKAKEHYMVRLKREWKDDAELADETKDEPVADENKDAPVKPNSKLLTLENKQLQIYFPRFRKLKSVPYSGTGKHRYSFQRITVPSLPIHFCDCEEHSLSSELMKAKQISDYEDQAGHVKEEELNMMQFVMNKIFKREVNLSTENSQVEMPKEGRRSNYSIDDVLPIESDDDQDNEADNLVINIVGGGNSKSSLMKNGSLEHVNKESNFGKCQLSIGVAAQNKIKAQKEKNTGASDISVLIAKKKPRLIPSYESNRNVFTSTMPKKTEHIETYPKEPSSLPAPQPDQRESNQKLSTGLSWKQKSSWRTLVGQTANSSFSISHVLPDASMKQNLPESNDEIETGVTTDGKRKNLRKRVRFESADSEPVGLKDENLQEVSIDDIPTIDAQKLIGQGGSESACSERIGLPKDELLQDKVSAESPSIVAQSVATSKESESSEEMQHTDKKVSNHQIGRGRSWIHKSSWTELVSKMDNSPFSISNIMPDIASKRQNLPKYNGADTINPFNNKQQHSTKQLSGFIGNDSTGVWKSRILHDKIPPTGPSMASAAKNKESLVGLEGETNRVEKNLEIKQTDMNVSKSCGGKNISPPKKKLPFVDTGIGEVCTFMRSKESEKEWMKLRGAAKKKSNEKK